MNFDISNPYEAGTFNSKLYRIPALVTLKSGRILAVSDIRYGNGTDDPANVDIALRYSDDDGKTWSEGIFINEFCDMEYEDHNDAIPTSASFVDSAIAVDENGTIYHACDACPAYMGLWSEGTYGKDNGFIDGKLALCDFTAFEKAESTTLNKTNYPYYIDDFSDDGFAAVKKFSDNENYQNFYVNKAYDVFVKENDEYKPVLISQMKKDGTIGDKQITANVFYALSPIKLYPTYYLWMKQSFDNGETFSDGRILNLDVNSRGFTGFAPGRGLSFEYKGKNRVAFVIYDNNAHREFSSVIYTDDGGKTWKRSEKANKVGVSGKSSESQLVVLNNGVIRMYSRNVAGFISYCDSVDGCETFSEFKQDKALSYCSNCQFSVINYSKETEGKKVLVISYPSQKIRKCGVIKLGFVNNDNSVDWRYRKNVTTSIKPFSFVYSCLTELSDGSVADLYESDKAELSFKRYSFEDLTVNEKGLSLLEKIKSEIKNIIEK